MMKTTSCPKMPSSGTFPSHLDRHKNDPRRRRAVEAHLRRHRVLQRAAQCHRRVSRSLQRTLQLFLVDASLPNLLRRIPQTRRTFLPPMASCVNEQTRGKTRTGLSIRTRRSSLRLWRSTRRKLNTSRDSNVSNRAFLAHRHSIAMIPGRKKSRFLPSARAILWSTPFSPQWRRPSIFHAHDRHGFPRRIQKRRRSTSRSTRKCWYAWRKLVSITSYAVQFSESSLTPSRTPRSQETRRRGGRS